MNEHLYLKDPTSSDLGHKILSGSISLISSLGFEKFTFKKLAQEIDTTEASIYRYFESKHKILLYLINWYWSCMWFRIHMGTQNIMDAEVRLKNCIHILTAIPNPMNELVLDNELALIFDRIGIYTNDVLDAAGTKWNFLKYKPGLVGGHCIGVDPYYLAHKAESLGYHPQVILSGRRVNDTMGMFIAGKVVKMMIQKGTNVKGAKALILGVTFKENCPDIRNSKVVDIYNELVQFGLKVDVFDPHADASLVQKEYNIQLQQSPTKYDAIILAVAHKEFLQINLNA